MGEALVSVIMPVYNAEAFLREAIQSILSQTHQNLELLVIDDASTDKSLAIAESFNDTRIRIHRKSVNTGYTESLNSCLTKAKGKYVARMDADDISYPERLERQVAFMEANSAVAVCGTWFVLSDSMIPIQHPLGHEAIKVSLLEFTPIGHPTAMIRTSFLRDHGLKYNPEFEPAEDADLWQRISECGKLANIDDVLLMYRVHESQVSNSHEKRQRIAAEEVSKRHLSKVAKDISPLITKRAISAEEVSTAMPTLIQYASLMKQLKNAERTNDKVNFFDKPLFADFVRRKTEQFRRMWFYNTKRFFPFNLIFFLYPLSGMTMHLTVVELKTILRNRVLIA